MPKALLFANTDWYLFNFRLPLARALTRAGWEVVLLSPPGDFSKKLQQAGFVWRPVGMSRAKLGLLSELGTVMQLLHIYREERPDVAHHFTLKCIAYGGLASRLVGTKSIHALTGLGHVFTSDSLRNRFLRPIVRLVLRLVLKDCDVVFQNPDDLAEFEHAGLIKGSRAHLIRGSGVDCDRFVPTGRRIGTEAVTIVMVARLLREKGVREYVNAARIVKQEHPTTRFLLIGDEDPGNPSAISKQELVDWRNEGLIEFLGFRSDIPEMLAIADIAVLPSHREGVPRSLLEAAACALPLIATDVPGCREIVRNGHNGVLTPREDFNALAQAMSMLIINPELRSRMGNASRERVVAEYSEELVIHRTLGLYAEGSSK